MSTYFRNDSKMEKMVILRQFPRHQIDKTLQSHVLTALYGPSLRLQTNRSFHCKFNTLPHEEMRRIEPLRATPLQEPAAGIQPMPLPLRCRQTVPNFFDIRNVTSIDKRPNSPVYSRLEVGDAYTLCCEIRGSTPRHDTRRGSQIREGGIGSR